ncbi:MAG: cation:proton antiporter [Clostridia bacterium]|nr:cation:proton antiporter [Clostridia bacterium]
MTVLLGIAVALAAGLALSRAAKLINLPAVTAYLVAGILIGPFCLGAIGVPGLGFNSFEQTEALGIICDVALGFIAFAIGNEFRLSDIKAIGKQAFVIGVFQAVLATVFVDIALVALHFIFPDKITLPMAITLGAIASATAPAATLMVVRQYKAHGKLTDLLLPIVALDDAVGLVIFSVSFGIARAIGSGDVDIISIAVNPLIEIISSLLLGIVVGIAFSWSEKFFHSRSKRLALAVTAVLLTVGLSQLDTAPGPVEIGFSPLLSCMMLSTVFCNISEYSPEIMDRLDRWTAPLFILFFVISGAELDLSVFKDLAIVLIGVVYIIFRSLGKYFGAGLSAGFTHCEPSVRKYLGITLLPQAGVALGMANSVGVLGPEGAMIRNIVLFGVLVYELVGPSLTKMALTKAGEIDEKPEGKTARANPENAGRKRHS